MLTRRGLVTGVAALTAAAPGGAQAPDAAAVVVLDRDSLFERSLFGQRIRREIETASFALASENRRIEAELAAEEQALTTRRADMDAEAFQALAEAFDAKVEGIRQAQDAKARDLQQRSDRAQALFQESVRPVLARLAGELRAQVILDRRSVIAAADQADITDLALRRLDEALGDGAGLLDPDAPPARPVAPPGAGDR